MKSKENGLCYSEAKLYKDSDYIYDFYQDKNVEEVCKCLEILQGLKIRIKSFLSEWPDHPTLIQVF